MAGRVVSLTSARSGTVLLPDGTEVKGVQGLYGCKVGETYRFKVISIGGEGKIKRLTRA